NEERLRSILRSMSEGVLVRDARGLITDCNVAAARILGVRREALSGRRPEDVVGRITGEDGEEIPAERLLGGATGLVARIGRHDGTWAWIAASSSPVLDAAGRSEGVVTTLSDITRRRELTAEQVALRR